LKLIKNNAEGIMTVMVAQDDLHCVYWFVVAVLLPKISDRKLCIAFTLGGGHDVGLRLGRNFVIYVKADFTLHGEFT
jgi:hypothetical protein